MRANAIIAGCVVLGAMLAPPPLRAADAILKLGTTAPLSGPASAYASVVKTEAAYFAKLNDEGGIGGRRIEFLVHDDAYSPPKTVEQTRRLVEQDEVLAMFSAVGTAPNIAVQKYLNGAKVPQLFVSSGASRWNDPEHFPWTVGFNPPYDVEGRIYARYILKTMPNAKIALIIPNEDAGRDYLRGFKDGLGEHGDQLVAQTTYLTSDPTIDSQIATMQQSGADVFFAEATPKFAAMAIRKAASIGWKPLIILPAVSNSIGAVLEPAGLDNAVGIVTGLYLKDAADPKWANDPAVKDFLAFMAKYQPNASVADGLNAQGYTVAQLMAKVLENCLGDFSRDSILKQATNIPDTALPMLLPGIHAGTDPKHYTAIRQLQLARFDGKAWVPFGDVLGD